MIAAGTRLGPYEILSPLGAGGMGEVYRARDTRLGREVAVKVLPPEFVADAGRLRRFEQEARAASALNHPAIITVFDVGEAEGTPFVVLELLEGETLREKLASGPLAPRRAVDYALQIARGLAAAHAMGIVHRDLKPENLFVVRDGRVKILDFGLARLTARPPGETGPSNDDPTLPARTEPGFVLGTVGYMSPEQVRGQPADHRADIFALGSILYEMLSGQRAFRRDSGIETMNAILKEEPPDLPESAGGAPAGLQRVVQHCLEKDREHRFQSASDFAFALEALSSLSSSGMARVASVSFLRKAARPAAVFAALLVAAALAYLAGRRGVGPVPASFRRLTFERGFVTAARFTADAGTIVYSAAWGGAPQRVFVSYPESPESRPLLPLAADVLAVSASGELAVGLVRPGSQMLARLPLDGGAPREVLEGVSWAAWSPDGRSLAVVRTEGGKQRLEFPIGKVLYETGGWITHPRVSPDGQRVAFLDHPVLSDDGGRVAVIVGGKRREMSREFRSVWGLAWAKAGREIWFTAAEAGARSLWSIDPSGRERLLLATPGRLTLEDVARDGRALVTRDNVRVEMFGKPPGAAAEHDLSGLDWSLVRDISEDGARVLFNESGEGGGESYGIYVRGTDGSPAVRLGEGSALALSPDGSRVLARQRAGASPLVLLPTGAGEIKALAGPPLSVQRASFLPDGRRLLLSGNAPGARPRVWLQDALSGAPVPVTEEGVTGFWNGASPDGRTFLARTSDGEVVAEAIGGGASQPLAGIEKDDLPIRWSADGRSLYVARMTGLPGRVWRVDLATGRRETWLTVSPADRAGVTSIQGLRLSADGRAYVYSYRRVQSDLYLVSGLQ